MKAINLLIRFLLELCALYAMGYFGYHLAKGAAARIVLAIAGPIFFALLWWLFAAHKAKFPPPQPWKAIVGFLFLEGAALALALSGQLVWAGVFAVVITGNTAVLEFFYPSAQEDIDATRPA